MPVDNLWITRRDNAQKSVDNSTYLTGLLPSSSESERLKACSSLRRVVVWGVLCLFTGSLSLQMQPAEATSNADHYKLYAHARIINYEQFQCLNKLITAESSWRIKAINGSHYGLGQMRNKSYRNLDGYRQIDWTIRYINGRYGSMCNAYRHWQKKGWH